MALDLGRIQKELKEIERDKASGVTVELKSNSLQHFIGYVPGPKDTPYEGGLFKVDIKLESSYPFVPPKMTFLSKVWHPNVSSQSGAICLDILKDQWSPTLTLKTALLCLQALLASPQPDDPQVSTPPFWFRMYSSCLHIFYFSAAKRSCWLLHSINLASKIDLEPHFSTADTCLWRTIAHVRKCSSASRECWALGV
ncbi:hypothetical protein VaNZ11_006421 [Volvox africanus]|uniref:UBC core domain-containing protein n=1 Tax=Volvox africanus TaxID=51714 RepID=A0ABQ5S145_9CHLO|nr:hypothetical protein VaNZ11_006421 [Volvox africanus]